MKYRVGYRNHHTNWQWYEMYDCGTLESALQNASKSIAAEMKHSEIGIFAMNDGASYWKDRRPIRLLNRQGRPDAQIPASIGGIINGMYKPGKNPR